ncbi:MAG TPA: cytochrome c biogenesis protein CcdA [Candidatus Limnocylindrales bacterium]|nr:cytochrome c biogenesis protein CcdA [Candidatus Limnocylindrales bacterium]
MHGTLMEIWSGTSAAGSIILPFLLGLLGFIEPCSLGANLIFLQYLLPFTQRARILQSLLFTLTRALFLSLIGLLAALLGQQFIGIQSHYILFLGTLYMVFGLIILMKGPVWSFTLPFPRLSESSMTTLLGGAFGLAVPACASPLILALLGRAALSGQLLFGFSSLFVFGLGLSLPLVIAVYSEKAWETMIRVARRYSYSTQYLIGGILVFAGFYTLFTRSGSLQAILQK